MAWILLLLSLASGLRVDLEDLLNIHTRVGKDVEQEPSSVQQDKVTVEQQASFPQLDRELFGRC